MTDPAPRTGSGRHAQLGRDSRQARPRRHITRRRAIACVLACAAGLAWVASSAVSPVLVPGPHASAAASLPLVGAAHVPGASVARVAASLPAGPVSSSSRSAAGASRSQAAASPAAAPVAATPKGLPNLGGQRFGTPPINPDTLPAHLTPSLAKAYADVPISYAQGCHSAPYEAAIHPCVYGDPHGKTTVVLFGDSHAQQWMPAASRAGKAKGWRIVVLTKSACPSVQVRFAEPNFPGAQVSCNTWRSRAEAWLRSHPPDLIVVSNSHGYKLIDSAAKPIPKNAREATWQRGLVRTLRAMPHGPILAVLADTPALEANVPVCLAAHPKQISACETPRSSAIDSVHDAAEQATAEAAGASFVSLNNVVCWSDPCPVVTGNVLMWRNQDHLTATFSALLAPSFATMAAGVMAAAVTAHSAVPRPIAPVMPASRLLPARI